jgi:hypothetical protein
MRVFARPRYPSGCAANEVAKVAGRWLDTCLVGAEAQCLILRLGGVIDFDQPRSVGRFGLADDLLVPGPDLFNDRSCEGSWVLTQVSSTSAASTQIRNRIRGSSDPDTGHRLG